jgi:hypothetical protein
VSPVMVATTWKTGCPGATAMRRGSKPSARSLRTTTTTRCPRSGVESLAVIDMRDFAKADPHMTSASTERAARVFTDLFYTGTTEMGSKWSCLHYRRFSTHDDCEHAAPSSVETNGAKAAPLQLVAQPRPTGSGPLRESMGSGSRRMPRLARLKALWRDLDDRLCGSGGRDGIGVSMHDLPAVFFASIKGRAAQRDCGDLIAASHLCLESFKLVNTGDITADVLRKLIEADRMALPVMLRCSRHRVAY